MNSLKSSEKYLLLYCKVYLLKILKNHGFGRRLRGNILSFTKELNLENYDEVNNWFY